MDKPDFYTESLRVYPNNVTDKYLWDGPHKAGINPKWQRSQDETETFARCRQEGCEHVWNTHVVPLQDENERLKTTLIAGAELIKENWEKLCDEEGYGPQNLLLRMDGTLNTSGYPGYSSGAFFNLESENKALREENLRLQNRGSSLENIAEMDRKTEYQYNQLYKEKEALRDQLEACEQHNKILCEQMEELLKEIERLKINQPPFR